MAAIANPMLLLSAQWAILGIVLVVGLFFVWRRINQLEERIMELVCVRAPAYDGPSSNPVCYKRQHASAASAAEDEDDESETVQQVVSVGDSNEADAALMRAIFEQAMPGGAFMMFSSPEDAEEDVYEEDERATPTVVIDEDNGSDPGTEVAVGRYSKTQLRKMPVDALKELLVAAGLPTDGNKNALVQRLAEC